MIMMEAFLKGVSLFPEYFFPPLMPMRITLPLLSSRESLFLLASTGEDPFLVMFKNCPAGFRPLRIFFFPSSPR